MQASDINFLLKLPADSAREACQPIRLQIGKHFRRSRGCATVWTNSLQASACCTAAHSQSAMDLAAFGRTLLAEVATEASESSAADFCANKDPTLSHRVNNPGARRICHIKRFTSSVCSQPVVTSFSRIAVFNPGACLVTGMPDDPPCCQVRC